MTPQFNNLETPRLPECPGRRGWPWDAAGPSPAPADLGLSWPRITVVTPSYNQADFLEQTIRSVLLQGYPNLEYIVLDGGSKDGSIDVIRKYERWIDHWSSAKDGGQAEAIHRGFRRAAGELVAWQNSDDMYLPGALLAFGRLFARHPRAELAIGGCVWIDANGATLRSRSGYPIYHPGRRLTHTEALLWGMGANQPATMFRREAFFAVGGFDRSLHCCFDYDAILRLTRRGPARALRRPAACFRVHGASKTTTEPQTFDQELRQIRERFQVSQRPMWQRALAAQIYCRRERWARRWFLLQSRLGLGATNELLPRLAGCGSAR